MKALSVRQPWAELIASGAKTFEVRTWQTQYRGPLLICASKIPSKISNYDLFHRNLGLPPTIKDLMYGSAICTVDLVDIRSGDGCMHDAAKACCDFRKTDWLWVLENVKRVNPFPVTGRLSLFEVTTKKER